MVDGAIRVRVTCFVNGIVVGRPRVSCLDVTHSRQCSTDALDDDNLLGTISIIILHVSATTMRRR